MIDLDSAGLVVERPGPMATIQDLGRRGFRSRGVPDGGAFDQESHGLANALVGNGPGEATIELLLFGGTFRAELPLALALAGAPMPVRVRRASGDDRHFKPPVAFGLEPGDILELGGTPIGARAYLAVRGGWRTPNVLGSRSTEHPLRPGEAIPAVPGATPVRWPDRSSVRPMDSTDPIRLVDGPDADLLDDRQCLHSPFVVSAESDRMGVRLDGAEVPVSSPADRRSTPVSAGAVQVSGGRLILLGVSCGTMGGYPHVAHVASIDLDRIGQLRPGDAVRFERISLEDARRLDRLDRLRRRSTLLRILEMAGNRTG